MNEERTNFLKSTDEIAQRCLLAEQSHSEAVRATEQLKHELASEKDRAHKSRQNFTRDLETWVIVVVVKQTPQYQTDESDLFIKKCLIFRLHQKSETSDRKCVALAENVRRLKHELLASKTEVLVRSI